MSRSEHFNQPFQRCSFDSLTDKVSTIVDPNNRKLRSRGRFALQKPRIFEKPGFFFFKVTHYRELIDKWLIPPLA